MYLPEKLQERRFVDWNYLVKGLVVIWDLACLVGIEEALNACLKGDQEAKLAEILGRMGHDTDAIAALLAICLAYREQPIRSPTASVAKRIPEASLLRELSIRLRSVPAYAVALSL